MEKLLGLPVLASENGKGVDSLMGYIHWLMIALFVGWLVYFLFALWRFNRARQPRADYQGVKNHASSYVEVTVAAIEAVLLLFVAVPLWARHTEKFPEESKATRIQVVAQQFAWNFRYPGQDGEFGRQDMKFVTPDNVFGVDPNDLAGKDDVQVLNVFHVPVNKPVIAYISSKDVIHSFKLIAMRVTQDAIPGMRIPIHFRPTKTGTFQIYCAQLCGNGHAAMANGRIVVDTQADYDQWLAAQSRSTTSPQSFE
jgi:cytochrome c oxidase subunit II